MGIECTSVGVSVFLVGYAVVSHTAATTEKSLYYYIANPLCSLISRCAEGK
jgi:hypothetical protein